MLLLVLLAIDELGSQPCSNPREVELGPNICSVVSNGSFPAKFYPSSLDCSFAFDVLSSSSLNLNPPLPFYGNKYDNFVVSLLTAVDLVYTCVSDTRSL